MRRRTIRRQVSLSGVSFPGLQPTRVTLRPAAAGTGIVFNSGIRAVVSNARCRGRATWLSRGRQAVGMVEHLLAACSGLRVTDLEASVVGEGLPFIDGSSRPFAAALRRAGLKTLDGVLDEAVLGRPVMVEGNGGFIAAVPASRLRLTVLIRIAGIGAQLLSRVVTPAVFERELGWARTYGSIPSGMSLAELKRRLGLRYRVRRFRGNALPARERGRIEPCRHKMVDLLGDLALLGAWLRAEVFAFQPSHRLNLGFVGRLAQTTEAG